MLLKLVRSGFSSDIEPIKFDAGCFRCLNMFDSGIWWVSIRTIKAAQCRLYAMNLYCLIIPCSNSHNYPFLSGIIGNGVQADFPDCSICATVHIQWLLVYLQEPYQILFDAKPLIFRLIIRWRPLGWQWHLSVFFPECKWVRAHSGNNREEYLKRPWKAKVKAWCKAVGAAFAQF